MSTGGRFTTLNSFWQHIKPASLPEWFFWTYGAIIACSILLGIATELYFLAGLPAFFLLIYLTIVDFRKVFFLLIASIPLSTEIVLPNGFGTDLPSEPLIVGLMLVFLIYLAQPGKRLDIRFLLHPITLLLVAHVGWIYLTTFTSSLWVVSLKFALAKTWYVVVFYFMAGWLLTTEKDIRQLFWAFFYPLLFTVLVVFVRHGLDGFTFQSIHKVLHPFYRNHVNYAVSLALFAPLMWLALSWMAPHTRKRKIMLGIAAFMLLAVYLSFTRAAYVALLVAVGGYFVVRWRLTRLAIASALLATVITFGFFAYRNAYLLYAPNYDRTIAHQSFDNLIEATYKMEDISTMERLYRWIAGVYMSREYPVVGFGPGNFLNFYKSYTVNSFQTYVSNNPEQSGIHCYYLMTLVDQGIIGLLLFLALSFYTLIRGEQIYHSISDPPRKRIVMMALLCLIVIHTFLIINDLIEVDKVGSFFFIYTALLVNADIRWRQIV
jgi:O-antigen ligase